MQPLTERTDWNASNFSSLSPLCTCICQLLLSISAGMSQTSKNKHKGIKQYEGEGEGRKCDICWTFNVETANKA